MSEPSPHPARPVYRLRIMSIRGDDTRRLRWALKAMPRRRGLQCISIEIEVPK